MANNNNIFNAVIAGAGGANQQRWITATNSDDFSEYQAIIETIATAVDAAIDPIGGDANIAQTALMQSICQAIFAGRLLQTNAEANYSPIVESIVALYGSLEASLLPPTGGGGGGSTIPLSIEAWVDPTTTVAPASQDGSIGAPFDSIGDAIDYIREQKATIDAAGTIYLGNGDYAGESFTWEVFDTDPTAARNMLVLQGQGGVFNIGTISIDGTEDSETAPIVIVNDVGADSLVDGGLGIAAINMPGEGFIATLQLRNCRVDGGIGNVAENQRINLVRTTVMGTTNLSSSTITDGSFVENIDGLVGINTFRDSTFGILNLADENVTVNVKDCRFAGATFTAQGNAGSTFINCEIAADVVTIGNGTFTGCSGFGSTSCSVSAQPTFDNCTFAVGEINGISVDSYISMYGCRSNGADPITISSPNLRMEQCEWGGSLSIDTELQMDLSSYQTILKGGHSITGTSTFNLTDVPDPQQQTGWDGADPVALTLLASGHKPGLYLISASIYSHATDTAEITGEIGWSQPIAGAATFAFGTGDASGGDGMLFSSTCVVQSDGTAPITWTVSATGVGENLDVDINATCLIQGA